MCLRRFQNFITSLVTEWPLNLLLALTVNRNLYTAFLVRICIKIMRYRNFTNDCNILNDPFDAKESFFLSSPSINDSKAISRTVMRLRSSNSKNLPSSTYGSLGSYLNKKELLKIVKFLNVDYMTVKQNLDIKNIRSKINKQNSLQLCFQVIGRKRLKFKMCFWFCFDYYWLIISLFAFCNGSLARFEGRKLDEWKEIFGMNCVK